MRWYTHLIPVFERQRQVGLSEYKASLVYIANSKTVNNTVLKKKLIKPNPTKNFIIFT